MFCFEASVLERWKRTISVGRQHESTIFYWHGSNGIHQRPSETMDFNQRTCFEEGENSRIGWKGDSHRLLGFTWCDFHLLAGQEQNGQRALLCRIIADKTTPFGEEKKYSMTQCTTMTTHRHTAPQSPQPNWLNWATNCSPIHRIPQI